MSNNPFADRQSRADPFDRGTVFAELVKEFSLAFVSHGNIHVHGLHQKKLLIVVIGYLDLNLSTALALVLLRHLG